MIEADRIAAEKLADLAVPIQQTPPLKSGGLDQAWLRSWRPTGTVAQDFRRDALVDQRFLRAFLSWNHLHSYLVHRGACRESIHGARNAWRSFRAQVLQGIAPASLAQLSILLAQLRAEGDGFWHNRGILVGSQRRGQLLCNKDCTGLVAFADGERLPEIDILWVREGHRRLGLGTLLIMAVMDRRKQADFFTGRPVTGEGVRFLQGPIQQLLRKP